MATSEEEKLEEVTFYLPRRHRPLIYLQRLKSALWYSIGKIVDEETLKLGVNATPQFIGSLTELVWAQLGASPSTDTRFCIYKPKSQTNA